MYLNIPSNLPVSRVLNQLEHCLSRHNRVILQASTGAGKTTLVPLHMMLSGTISGNIVMLEPRRLATSTAATRMASLIGEPVGKTVGYRMQMDHRVSPQTKIEVVTEGVLTRMIQSDPELSGTDLIIFDEFHERSLQGDLGLALALQSQELRDTPLKILVMSATIDTDSLSQQLSAPVITSEGFLHPVTTHYLDKPLQDRQFHTVCQATASMIKQALAETTGNILAFLPGSGEIRKTSQLLQANTLPTGTEICPLFGDMPLDKQRQAIQPTRHGHRKVVLATAIAETSLTIEGICVVVDSGLSRHAVYNPGTGMNQLVTRRLSKSSADQRKGRAGRLEPGICYRLWTKGEHQQLEESHPPEITFTDLTPLALELHAWGCTQPEELFWLDQPGKGRYQHALTLLNQLNAIESIDQQRYRITKHGLAMVKLGTHPRLAHMLLRAVDLNMQATGYRLAAILSERDILGSTSQTADIHLRLSFFEKKQPSNEFKAALTQINRHIARWKKIIPVVRPEQPGNDNAARLLLTAWPDRLAKRRGNSSTYLTAGGQGVELKPDDPLSACEYLVIPHMGGHQHQRNATVFLACPVDNYLIYEELTEQVEEIESITWDSQVKRVVATRQDQLGALTLDQQNIARPSPDKIIKALLNGIKKEGLNILSWDKYALQLQARLCFLSQYNHLMDSPLPDFSNTGLMADLNSWLTPYLENISRGDQLARLNLTDILKARLNWNQIQTLDSEAPANWQAPSGSTIRICYDKPEEPKLSIRLQEVFGLQTTPRIGFGQHPLTIELLSPAQRPVQITKDLNNFWQSTYHEVKKDLKGRYPKHYWPDDPTVAEATRYTRPRRS